MHPTSSPREPTAARGSASRGKTVPSWFSSIHYSLPLSGPGAVWPGAAPPPLWASVSLCVTGGSADPSQLQRALRLLTGGRSLIRGRQPGRGGGAGGIVRICISSPGRVEEQPRRPPDSPQPSPSWFPGASALCEGASVPTLGVLEAQSWAPVRRQKEARKGGYWEGGMPLSSDPESPPCPCSWPV